MTEVPDIDFTVLNPTVITEFRANAGVVAGQFGGPMLLLTSTGAKSGERRVNPLIYHIDGDRLVVFASNHGAPKPPDWYHNVVAHPEVVVEVSTESFPAIAGVADESERDRLWADATAIQPFLVELQAKSGRQIPLVILRRHR